MSEPTQPPHGDEAAESAVPAPARCCTTCGYEVDERTAICPECGKNPAWCVCSARFTRTSLLVFAMAILSAGLLVGCSLHDAVFNGFPPLRHRPSRLLAGIVLGVVTLDMLVAWRAIRPMIAQRGVLLPPPGDWFLIPPVVLLGFSVWLAAVWDDVAW